MIGALIVGAVGAIVSGAVAVSKALAVVGFTIDGLKVIGSAILCIAKALGIIKHDVEEIGDRALQAEEQDMTPEKYSSYEEWVRAIEKDDWGYDPEKNKGMMPERKILKGIEVSAGVAIEKFPKLPVQDFLVLSEKVPGFFTVERMEEIGKLASSNVEAFGKIVGYVTGTMKDRTSIDEASDILMDIEKTIDPGIDIDSAYDRVASFYAAK